MHDAPKHSFKYLRRRYINLFSETEEEYWRLGKQMVTIHIQLRLKFYRDINKCKNSTKKLYKYAT